MFRKARRRVPGVYVFRTRRHLRPWRKETGYVGKSRHMPSRKRCHEGVCAHKGHEPKPWLDLVASYWTIRLPWWLGWDWITLSLETLLILVLRPRYNDKKNPRKSKVRKYEQIRQRADRDSAGRGYQAQVQLARVADVAVRVLGVALILGGIVGYWMWGR